MNVTSIQYIDISRGGGSVKRVGGFIKMNPNYLCIYCGSHKIGMIYWDGRIKKYVMWCMKCKKEFLL